MIVSPSTVTVASGMSDEKAKDDRSDPPCGRLLRVSAVHYPGLRSHPQHVLAVEQMSGFGGVLSFELRGGFAAATRFVERLELAVYAASLGGTETLDVHPASMWVQQLSREQRAAAGVVDGLVRVAVGLEDQRDIIADFETALSDD
jgi:cystathionine beta-lyase/cystathionine gamma-synthase